MNNLYIYIYIYICITPGTGNWVVPGGGTEFASACEGKALNGTWTEVSSLDSYIYIYVYICIHIYVLLLTCYCCLFVCV